MSQAPGCTQERVGALQAGVSGRVVSVVGQVLDLDLDVVWQAAAGFGVGRWAGMGGPRHMPGRSEALLACWTSGAEVCRAMIIIVFNRSSMTAPPFSPRRSGVAALVRTKGVRGDATGGWGVAVFPR